MSDGWQGKAVGTSGEATRLELDRELDGGRKGRETRTNSGVCSEITSWRIVKERKLLTCCVWLAAILRQWRGTEPEARPP